MAQCRSIKRTHNWVSSLSHLPQHHRPRRQIPRSRHPRQNGAATRTEAIALGIRRGLVLVLVLLLHSSSIPRVFGQLCMRSTCPILGQYEFVFDTLPDLSYLLVLPFCVLGRNCIRANIAGDLMTSLVGSITGDRRSAHRHHLKIRFQYHARAAFASEFSADSENMSDSGIFFATKQQLSVGAVVDLLVEMSNAVDGAQTLQWLYTGYVVRIDPSDPPNDVRGIAVQFVCYEIRHLEQRCVWKPPSSAAAGLFPNGQTAVMAPWSSPI